MDTGASTLNRTPTNVEKLRGLPWGVAWSVTNAVFAQYTFFGSIFVLFLNALDLDKAQIGSLLALLPFLGLIAVFIAPAAARFGYKRTFIISFAARTTMGIFLFLTPLLLVQLGPEAVLAFIIITVGAFGLFRAAGFTAYYPWQQEQVPDTLRGKYTALKNTLANLTSLLAVMVAGYVLGPDPDLSRFMILIAIGVAFGFASLWTATKIPGGAPLREDRAERGSYREMTGAARDTNFVYYLVGIGLVTVATAPLASFVPLFMKEQVGLSSDQVVWLDTGLLLGGLVSSLLWGWLADRYGSKPVMISGVYLLPLLPLAWLLMPRFSAWSLYIALAIALAQGLINTGWNIGSGRLLFVGVVPPEKSAAYMALYYAWAGIAGGLGQMLGGRLVDGTAGLSGQWWLLSLDPYTLLFVMGIALPVISSFLLTRVRADDVVTTRQFATMFLRGNPFLALESLVRYHRARGERETVAMTERLGTTRSPLTVEELLQAHHDPRFPVRFEAIVSMARHGPDPQLTDALIETLEGNEPALSTLAAWALGRIGDERALEALRRGLNARYRSVQAHCVRSLGNLGDRTVLPTLLERLPKEEDVGLQLALAAALGQLGATEAIAPLCDLLWRSSSADARMEFALALARLVGEEHDFIHLERRVESEPGTAFSQAVTALKGKLIKVHHSSAEIEQTLDSAAGVLAEEDLPQGLELLRAGLQILPASHLATPCQTVVRECIARLEEFGAQRPEYAILALHAATCGLSG